MLDKCGGQSCIARIPRLCKLGYSSRSAKDSRHLGPALVEFLELFYICTLLQGKRSALGEKSGAALGSSFGCRVGPLPGQPPIMLGNRHGSG